MSVFERDGRWCARLYSKGQRIWLGTFDSEAEAWARFNAARETRVLGNETCAQFADRWLSDYDRDSRTSAPRWGEYTKRSYQGYLKAFKAAFGSVRLRELTIAKVRPWATSQPECSVRCAAAMLADARRDGLVVSNPFENLRLSQSPGRRDITPLSEDELLELGERALSIHGGYGSTAKAILLTLGYTGIRPGELAALEPGDIDLANLELNVRQSWNGLELKSPKNGRSRRVIMAPQAHEAIADVPRALHSPWVFTTKYGHQLNKGSFRYVWDPLRNAIGQPKLALYSLRHTAATLLLERGVTPEDVAFQLGHSDSTLVVRLYGHPSDEGKRERLKRAFASPTQLQSVRAATRTQKGA